MEKLITKNLILRKAQTEDLEQIWNNIWKDETIAKTMLWQPTKTKEEAIDRMKKTIEYQNNNYAYFVCLKSDNQPIGYAGIKELTDGIYEESGICIATKYQNQGYAKEVVSALKKLIFEKLNGNKFLYGCFTNNEKSKRVCISQGFIYSHSEKTIRKWDQQSFIIDYYYFDKNMYK